MQFLKKKLMFKSLVDCLIVIKRVSSSPTDYYNLRVEAEHFVECCCYEFSVSWKNFVLEL